MFILLLLLALYVKVPTPPHKTQIKHTDTRTEKITNYLQSKNSPLASSSAYLVAFSDQFKVDPALVIGISKAESGFGTHIPQGSNNPFGFRCTDTLPCLKFNNYPTAIWHLAKTLATKPAYKKFRETGDVRVLAETYLSGDKERWTATVKGVMEELK